MYINMYIYMQHSITCNTCIYMLYLHIVQDHDHDSKVSLKDFKTTVEGDTLLIEALGPCLPERKVSIFTNTQTEEYTGMLIEKCLL